MFPYGLRADLAIFRDSLQRELPDLLCEERSGFMPGRFIFYFALAIDSFPRITVTNAFGRLNNVPVRRFVHVHQRDFCRRTARQRIVTVPGYRSRIQLRVRICARPKKTRQAAESTNFVTKTTDPSLLLRLPLTPRTHPIRPHIHGAPPVTRKGSNN